MSAPEQKLRVDRTRDQWGFSPVHQPANRGYAVLSINYRGSSGFGKAFITAADGDGAAKSYSFR